MTLAVAIPVGHLSGNMPAVIEMTLSGDRILQAGVAQMRFPSAKTNCIKINNVNGRTSSLNIRFPSHKV